MRTRPTPRPLSRSLSRNVSGSMAPVFSVDAMFTTELGDFYDFTDISKLSQDISQTTPVTTNGDIVAAAAGCRSTGANINLLRATVAVTPVYEGGLASTANAASMLVQSLGLSSTTTSVALITRAGSDTDVTMEGRYASASVAASIGAFAGPLGSFKAVSNNAESLRTLDSDSQNHVYIVNYEGGTTFKYYRDGVEIATLSPTVFSAMTVATVGFSPNTDMKALGFLFIDRGMTPTEVAGVTSWGLGL